MLPNCLLGALLALAAFPAFASPPPQLQVGAETYLFRGEFGAQILEYTPAGQADLAHFRDMLMLLPTPSRLVEPQMPGHLRELVQQAGDSGGRIMQQACEPRTETRAATCVLFVSYEKPGHTEYALTRLVAVPGAVLALAYARREYGPPAQTVARMRDWEASDEGRRRLGDFRDYTTRLGEAGLHMATRAPLQFDGEPYRLDSHNGVQYEFVREGEHAAGRWTRMLSLQRVPGVHDAASLHAYAAALEASARATGTVVAQSCGPDADGRMECSAAVLLEQGDVAELSILRTVLDGGVAVNAAIGLRDYGDGARARLAGFILGAEGKAYFTAAMRWRVPFDALPGPAAR